MWIVAGIIAVGIALYIFVKIYIASQEARATPTKSPVLRSWHTKVAGVTKKNRDGTSRQEIIADCSEGEDLLLVREPDNPKDANAVKVCRLAGGQIGYISAFLAARMAGEMDRGKKFSARISEITGGVEGKPTLGVNIEISVHEQDERLAPPTSQR